MHHQRFVRSITSGSVFALVILTMTLAACGGGSSANKALKLGTDLPVSGADAGAAKPAENGARLAVMQNHDLGSGYTLDISTKNDEAADNSGADAQIGKHNVTDLLNDTSVMAGVGPFNSGVAKVEMPLINNAGFTFISPSNTNPGLTKRQFADVNGITNFDELHPAGKPEAYFRLPGTDDVQGKVLAQIAAAAKPNPAGGTIPGATKVYVVDDNTTYGIGLAQYFMQNFTAGGGSTVGPDHLTHANASTTIPGLVTKILSNQVQAVFYGGVTSQGGGLLKKALVAANPAAAGILFIGGDGIANDSAWIADATPAAAIGTIATTPGVNQTLQSTSTFTAFKSAYQQAFPNADFTDYSVLGYDAAMIEITAIKNVIGAGKTVTRAAVRDEVAKIQYTGLSGQISFDNNGDNSGPKIFNVYAITDTSGKWALQEQFPAS